MSAKTNVHSSVHMSGKKEKKKRECLQQVSKTWQQRGMDQWSATQLENQPSLHAFDVLKGKSQQLLHSNCFEHQQRLLPEQVAHSLYSLVLFIYNKIIRVTPDVTTVDPLQYGLLKFDRNWKIYNYFMYTLLIKKNT